MERLTSLINRLKEKHEAGSSNGELLRLVDQLRNELTLLVHENTNTLPSASVSVMMPAGYQPASFVLEEETITNQHPLMASAIEMEKEELMVTQITEQISLEPIHVAQSQIPELNQEKTGTFFQVPKPPRIAMIEEELAEEEEPKIEVLMEKEPEPLPEKTFVEDILDFLKFSRPEKTDAESLPIHERNELEEKPVVFEFNISEEMPVEADRISSSMLLEREEIEEILTLEMPETKQKPKELHEILASRVVATPSMQSTGKTMLSEKFGGSKITDLRKGIAINDRFRFIKSLFRGDESLFDRSIKTINNFNILAEAQYWIQRELVVKLGWNDEDELVQQFYSLVSRRFL